MVVECLIDTGSQVSVISEGMVRSLDLKVIPVNPKVDLKTANGTKLEYRGQVITDIILWGKKSEKVGFIVTNIKGLFIIGMNILQTYGVISITGVSRGIHIRSRVSNGISSVSINNEEIVKVYIGCKNRIFKESIEKLTYKYRKIFFLNNDRLASAKVGLHSIRTIDKIPVAQPYRRIIPSQVEAVKNQIVKWEMGGVIVKSNSEYASPLVVVKKGTGEIRLCVDYRQLNNKTIKDAYPIPRIDDSLEALGGAKVFSSFDLKSAYHQIKIVKEDQFKTAFSSLWGLYEFTRMPFGLTNAPATFQRVISNLFRSEMYKFVVCYLDDILVYSKTWKEHLGHIEVVMMRLEEAGFQLNTGKCRLFINEIHFLGFKISDKGIGTIPDKIKTIIEWKRPKNLKELRSFLGVGSYYRRFIEGYTKIVHPLLKLTKSEAGVGSISKRMSRRVNIKWDDDCERAMHKIKDKLSSAPILALPRFEEAFILETDASHIGLGAVLSQVIDGERKVIAYASRSLKPGEENQANYSAKKLEFIAVVWAVTDKFKHYLMGAKQCTIFTDNSAVACIENKKQLTALEQRWVSRLAPFPIRFKYRTHIVADALSRRCEENNEVEGDDFKILYEDDLEINDISIIAGIEEGKIREMQMEEHRLKEIIKHLESGSINNDNYIIEEGVLYKNRKNGDKVLVVPRELIREILQGVHDANGHQGIDRTVARISLKYTWVGRYRDIKEYIDKCEICQVSKGGGRNPKIDMGYLGATRPLELVFLDFVNIDKSSDGRESILVMTDSYTKFTRAIPTRNQLAITVAKILMNEWIYCYGTPERIHTDQGRNFQAEVVREICKLFNINQSRTSPYHPEGNGQCERMNRSIINLLRVLCTEEKSKWPIHLPKMIHAYNIMPHATTGFSPFFLMFGREEKLPVDLRLERYGRGTDSDWLWETKQKMGEIGSKVKHRIELTRKKINDKKKEDELEAGTIVRIKKRKLGRRKLENIWGEEKWEVEGRVKGTSAYKIKFGQTCRVENRINLRVTKD